MLGYLYYYYFTNRNLKVKTLVDLMYEEYWKDYLYFYAEQSQSEPIMFFILLKRSNTSFGGISFKTSLSPDLTILNMG